MAISKVKINGFRSLNSVAIDFAQVTAIVGPNNSGKSNVLLAIARVLGRDWVTVRSFDDEDVHLRDPDGDIEIEVTFDPPISYSHFQKAPPVDIASLLFRYTRYLVGSAKGQRRLEQSCLNAKGSPVMVMTQAPKKGVPPSFAPLTNIPQSVRDQVPLIFIGTDRSVRSQLPAARTSMLRQLLEDVERDFLDPAQTIDVTRPDSTVDNVARSERFGELMREVMRVLRTDDFAALENAIKENALVQLGFDPLADADKLDFFFAPFDAMDFYKTLEMQVREGSFSINATELGQGIQNAIVLAILKAFEQRRKQGAILLIEEPEMFLHPQMQRSLYKTLRQLGQSNQVIYTTHSPHFVRIPEYNEVVVVRKDKNATRTQRSEVEVDAATREKLIKEFDPERNELFFATRLLLVEGDTEKLALPEYAKVLGLDLDLAGATIVEVGGKRNLKTFADIALSLGIPTGIVFDEDSSDFKDSAEESTFNESLKGYAREDGAVSVWMLSNNYEDHLRSALGEEKYQRLCQKYPGSKPIRARMIASEGLPVPAPFEEVLRWLAQRDRISEENP